MKKLILSTFLLVISGCIVLYSCKHKTALSTEKPKFKGKSFLSTDITLNGKNADDANKMVSDFMDDNSNSEKRLAIWVSKEWVLNIAKYLDLESSDSSIKADGVRFYLAKKQPGINTIVIVSTGNGYQDNFNHPNVDFSKFLLKVKNNPENYFTEDHKGADVGAKLFNGYDCSGYKSCVVTATYNIGCSDIVNAVNEFGKRPTQGLNTTSELYKLEMLKGLKDLLNTPDSLDIKPDGIRIYFAKDPTSHRHFFVIVPTQQNKIKNPDGSISHLDNFDCYGTSNLFGGTDTGELCPNHCSGATLPTP